MEKAREEEKPEKKLEERKARIKEKLALWFKNPYNKGLFAILILAFVLRIIILAITSQQGLWWDEAGYMSYSKKIAYGWNWTMQWNPHKPVLLSWLAAPIFQLGLGEISVRLLIFLFSFAAVWLTYLTCKEFFDKKIAIVSAFLMAVFWVPLFFTGRILTGLPSATLFFASLYFFYRSYIKKENPKFLWLFGIFFALAFMMRVSYGVLIIPFVVYVIMEEKLTFLKNKHLWISVFFILLTISPMMFWIYRMYPQNTIATFLGLKSAPVGGERFAAGLGIGGVLSSFIDLKYVLQWPLL